jgi:hypothetical protein
MNFLIVSRISIPAKDRTLPCWTYLRSLGHTVTVEHPDSVPSNVKPDVIISMGVTIMDETFRALERWPGVPNYQFMWDCYNWVWTPGKEGKEQAYHACRGKEYNYILYGDLLRRATEIWVPSECTGRRTTQWWGCTNWSVILSACPWWDHPNVRDDGYTLMCLREIPDPWWGVFERTCEKLGIPYKCTRHEVKYEEYQDAVAGCRFICAPLYELSTGGLSLMEAYRLGKPVLISDSEWNGGRDYFGRRAYYFKHGNEENFARMIAGMWCGSTMASDHKEYIETNFSDKRMVDDMLRRIECTSRK